VSRYQSTAQQAVRLFVRQLGQLVDNVKKGPTGGL